MMHETIWKPQTIGEASPTRDSIAERGQKSFRGSKESRFFDQFSNALAGNLQEGRRQRIVAITCARPSLQTCRPTEEAVDRIAFKRGAGDGLRDRHLDDPTGKRNNQTGVWDNLSRQSFVAVFDRVGVELAEAGTPGKGKERKSNCALEAVSVAAYKKRPKSLRRIFSLLMRRVAFLFQQFATPGQCEDRRLSCGIVIAGIEFQLYQQSALARRENVLAFTGGFTRKILPAMKLFLFSNIFHGIFRVISWLFGTVVRLTGAGRSRIFCFLNREYARNDSRDMLLSSILMNLFGRISSAIQVMPRRIIFLPWDACWLNLFIGSNVLRNYYDPALMRQICHGERSSVSITYA